MPKLGIPRGPYQKTGMSGLNPMKSIVRQLKAETKPKIPKVKMPKIKKF